MGNIKRQPPWRWCVIGRQVPAVVEGYCRGGAAGGKMLTGGGCVGDNMREL